MRKFVIIKNVEVCGLNAKSSDITMGMPPATTFCGFGEAMSRSTDLQVKSIAVGSVKFKVRGKGWNYSNTKFGWQNKGDGSKSSNNAPIQPKPQADAVFTLALEIYTDLNAEDTVKQVSNFMQAAKISGGTIGKFYKPFVKVAVCPDTLVSVKNAMMPSYLLLDKGVEADIFTDAVTRKLQPMVNGYKKLEEIVDKTNLRDKVTPAYLATPTYTMVGYKMASNVLDFDQALWQYTNNTKVNTIGGIYND